jgi:beta-alanine--pyruvate transaminase
MQSPVANSLDHFWMPFTSNREFKAEPRLVTRSEGMYCWDHKGGKILDGSSGLFCCAAGHGRPEIAKAVHDQLLANDYTAPFGLGHPGSFTLARKVAALCPEEINHGVLRQFGLGSDRHRAQDRDGLSPGARRGPADALRVRERAYHGVNIGGVSLSGMVRNRETFQGCHAQRRVHAPHLARENRFTRGQPERGVELADDLQRFARPMAARPSPPVFVEPIAGSTGVLVPPKGYLERLREICDATASCWCSTR